MARRHGRGRRGRRFGVLYKLLTLVVVCAAAVLALQQLSQGADNARR